ncbi:unnamed protein product [Aphanomyces euteiches]
MSTMAALLVVTAVGCSSKSNTTESPAPSQAVVKETAAAPAAKEPVTLKIFSQMPFPGTFTSGEQMDEVSKEIERVTGVKLEWDMQPTDDKAKALMASNDLPDIFILKDTSFIENLVKSEYIAELDPLMSSNGQDIQKVAAKAVEFSKKNLSNNSGKLYFIPGRVSTQETYFSPVVGLHMRWDYYKELNYPVMKSLDDIVNVTAQMLEKHPTTADGKKVFGFSPWLDWGMWHNNVLDQEAYGFTANTSVAFYDSVNYDYIDAINDDNSSLWQGALLFNKANRKGLVDPDAFTQKYDDATAKMDAGRVITQLAQWQTDKSNAKFQEEGKTDTGYVSIPLEGARYHGGNYNPIGLASYWSISKKSKHADRAMDVINYFFSEEGSRTILSGVKDKYWTMVDGKAKLTDLGLKAKSDPNFMTTTGIHKFQNMTGLDMMAKDSNGQFVDLFLEPDVISTTLTPLKKEWLEHYGVKSEDELWKKFGGYAANTAANALAPQQTDDIKRVDAKVDTYLKTNLPKVWFAKTDDEFNAVKTKMREDIKKISDYDKLVEFAKSSIAKTKELVQPYN